MRARLTIPGPVPGAGRVGRPRDFCAGVSAPGGVQVRVDTRVRLHGWRGRIYRLPVRVAHPMVVRAMVMNAVRRDRPDRCCIDAAREMTGKGRGTLL